MFLIVMQTMLEWDFRKLGELSVTSKYKKFHVVVWSICPGNGLLHALLYALAIS